MTHNLNRFIGLTILITLGLIFMPRLVDLLPEQYQNFASFIVIVFDFWVVFDLIVRLIYKIAGIPRSSSRQKRLSHQQTEIINRYWVAWILTSAVTVAAYVLIFDQNWENSILLFGAGIIVAALAFLNNKYKIMGHTKKELFK
jgi:hypothetical protein